MAYKNLYVMGEEEILTKALAKHERFLSYGINLNTDPASLLIALRKRAEKLTKSST